MIWFTALFPDCFSVHFLQRWRRRWCRLIGFRLWIMWKRRLLRAFRVRDKGWWSWAKTSRAWSRSRATHHSSSKLCAMLKVNCRNISATWHRYFDMQICLADCIVDINFNLDCSRFRQDNLTKAQPMVRRRCGRLHGIGWSTRGQDCKNWRTWRIVLLQPTEPSTQTPPLHKNHIPILLLFLLQSLSYKG